MKSAGSGHAILVVEDELTFARNVATYLSRLGYVTEIAASGEAAIDSLGHFRPDLVLMDFHLPGMDGLQTMQAMVQREPGLRFVVITGHDRVSTAVDAMKSGAIDYLIKPISLEKLAVVIERGIDAGRRDSALGYYRKASTSGVDAILGSSPAVTTVKEQLRRIIAAQHALHANAGDRAHPSVLIVGETGTGKELAARALHFDGPRAGAPFIEINCAAMPAALIESELFGYERGAFTDAKQRRLGLVEAAQGGTLFLDEIGDTEPATQVKLLKLLEERKIRRLGNVRDIAVDVAVVAATHQPLDAMVQQGRFRADLYFRLSTVRITLPPLRDRGRDVVTLAEQFLAIERQRYGRPRLGFSDTARELLQAYGWPGNVRELRNIVEQAVLLAQTEMIEPPDLPACESAVMRQFSETGPETRSATLASVEREALQKALEETGGNVSRAAERLNITRDAMRYRMARHGIVGDRGRRTE